MVPRDYNKSCLVDVTYSKNKVTICETKEKKNNTVRTRFKDRDQK
jgi:hypothetical protein